MSNNYYYLSERNFWEGETWYWYIPEKGNEDALETLGERIDEYMTGPFVDLEATRLDNPTLDRMRASMGPLGGSVPALSAHSAYALKGPVTEEYVDQKIADGNSRDTYFDVHNKLDGAISIPDGPIDPFRADEDGVRLYKGGIRSLVQETAQ